jgi:PAS domain S-box-containing protein
MIDHRSPLPQWIADLRGGKMLDANDAALQFWGMTREQFLAANFDRFFHPEEMPRWEEYVQKDVWGESGPWKCTRGDGAVFYCTVRWHMMQYQGVYCAFVFPLYAGDSPAAMAPLELDQSARGRTAGTSMD